MTSNDLTLEQVLAQAQTLSSLDKVRLDTAEADATRIRAWQATIERTAGALASDPIERPPQGEYEERDEIL